jgi:hypothetical protein
MQLRSIRRSKLRLLGELGVAVASLVFVDRRRRSLGPAAVLEESRLRGVKGRQRSVFARKRLRRLIRLVDACFPGGGNCYRRALAEIASDPSAANDRLVLGLRSGGGSQSGHAWIEGNRDSVARYDAEIAL